MNSDYLDQHLCSSIQVLHNSKELEFFVNIKHLTTIHMILNEYIVKTCNYDLCDVCRVTIITATYDNLLVVKLNQLSEQNIILSYYKLDVPSQQKIFLQEQLFALMTTNESILQRMYFSDHRYDLIPASHYLPNCKILIHDWTMMLIMIDLSASDARVTTVICNLFNKIYQGYGYEQLLKKMQVYQSEPSADHQVERIAELTISLNRTNLDILQSLSQHKYRDYMDFVATIAKTKPMMTLSVILLIPRKKKKCSLDAIDRQFVNNCHNEGSWSSERAVCTKCKMVVVCPTVIALDIFCSDKCAIANHPHKQDLVPFFKKAEKDLKSISVQCCDKCQTHVSLTKNSMSSILFCIFCKRLRLTCCNKLTDSLSKCKCPANQSDKDNRKAEKRSESEDDESTEDEDSEDESVEEYER